MTDTTPADAGYLLDEYDGPRFWAQVNFHGGKPYLDDPLARVGSDGGECWNWTGRVGGGEGFWYGRVVFQGHQHQAHRVGLLEFGGRISPGQHVDHLCRNSLCIRHDHLEAVTAAENVARGRRGREHVKACPNGHEYSESNTQWRERNGRRFRICITCNTASKHMTYLRTKATATEG